VTDLDGIKKRFCALSRLPDERSRRLVAAAEIDDKELAGIRLKRDRFHSDWNYEIHLRVVPSG